MSILHSILTRVSGHSTACSILAIGLALVAGCSGTDSSEQSGSKPEEVGAVRLLVVDDPTLAATIRREWSARGTGELVVRETSTDELLKGDTLDADALIYPSAVMGELAERKLILPVPGNVLDPEKPLDPEIERKEDPLVWRDVFRLLRMQEATWGNKTYGLPLGSPQLVVYYRGDLFERLGIAPPRTWQEYQQVVEQLSALTVADADPPRVEDAARTETDPADVTPDISANGGDRGEPAVRFATVEPLGPGWAGQVFLARAAPYARHRNQYSTLFDYSTMRPLIDGPPFVRALEELVAAAEYGPPEPWTITPEVSRQMFWNSEAAMALAWPTQTGGKSKTPADQGPVGDDSNSADAGLAEPQNIGSKVRIAALPGSVEVYQFLNKSWERRSNNEPQGVPLLAIAGRIGSVARETPRPRKAISVLVWLSGKEWSALISPASPATTLFRTTHVPVVRPWLPPEIDETTGRAYAELVETTQSSPTWFITLRLPGRAEYMSALDEAVHRALRKEASPEQALHETAVAWNLITDRHGRRRQREAYQRSIGLGP